MGNNKTAVRAAFAALAALTAFNSADAFQGTFPTPQTQQPAITATADDHARLHEMFTQSSKSLAQRAADPEQGCNQKLGGTGDEGTFKNADIEKVTSLSELLPRRTPEVAARYKAYAVMAEQAGYKVCYDERLTKGDYIYTVNTLDKVIALDPKSFTGPPTPLAAQQMAYASALENLFLLTKGFTEAASFGNVPQLQRNPNYAGIPAIVAPNLPIGAMTTRTGELVPGHAEDIAKKLLPSPVVRPKELPWELQKALRIYTV